MIRIRPITSHDIEPVQQLASDPTIAATANLPSPYPQNGAADWHARVSKGIADGRQVVFAITAKDKLVGVMSLNAIDLDRGQCALDYWIGRPHWGHGYATRAAALAINYAKFVLGINRITSGCLKSNIGSKRVLEKSGFTFTSETDYQGPFKDRFGSSKILHCVLDLNNAGAQQGGQPDASGAGCP